MKSGLSVSETRGIIVNALYTFGSNMSGIFTSLFIMNNTGSIRILSLYLMSRYVLYPLFFAIGGRLTSRLKASAVLAIGLMLIVVSLVFLVLFGTMIQSHHALVYVFGVIVGSGEGLFWFSINMMNQNITTKESRSMYLSVLGILNSIANIAAPLLSSLILMLTPTDDIGFILIFQIVAVLFVALVFLAFTISVPIHPSRYTLKRLLGRSNDKQWNYVREVNAVFGIRESFFLGLSGVIVYQSLNYEGTLMSNINAFFALLCIVAYAVAGKLIRRSNRMFWYRWGGIALTLSVLALGFSTSIRGVLLFGVLYNLGLPFFSNPYSIIKMNILSDYQNENIAGHVIVLESFLGLGRMIGFGIVVVLSFFFSEAMTIRIAVLFFALVMAVLLRVVGRYHRVRDQAVRESLGNTG